MRARDRARPDGRRRSSDRSARTAWIRTTSASPLIKRRTVTARCHPPIGSLSAATTMTTMAPASAIWRRRRPQIKASSNPIPRRSNAMNEIRPARLRSMPRRPVPLPTHSGLSATGPFHRGRDRPPTSPPRIAPSDGRPRGVSAADYARTGDSAHDRPIVACVVRLPVERALASTDCQARKRRVGQHDRARTTYLSAPCPDSLAVQ